MVDADGVIVAGNGTFAAAKALGWKTIDVVRTNLRGAFGGDGFLYVNSPDAGRVLRYDAATGAFRDVFVTPEQYNLGGPFPGQIAYVVPEPGASAIAAGAIVALLLRLRRVR